MKAFVRFRGYNAGDYYGHEMQLADAGNAEYEIVLNRGDALENDPLHGVMLTRNGVDYVQVTRMIRFRGVNFRAYSHPGEPNVQCQLIKVKELTS